MISVIKRFISESLHQANLIIYSHFKEFEKAHRVVRKIILYPDKISNIFSEVVVIALYCIVLTILIFVLPDVESYLELFKTQSNLDNLLFRISYICCYLWLAYIISIFIIWIKNILSRNFRKNHQILWLPLIIGIILKFIIFLIIVYFSLKSTILFIEKAKKWLVNDVNFLIKIIGVQDSMTLNLVLAPIASMVIWGLIIRLYNSWILTSIKIFDSSKNYSELKNSRNFSIVSFFGATFVCLFTLIYAIHGSNDEKIYEVKVALLITILLHSVNVLIIKYKMEKTIKVHNIINARQSL